jgi:DNA helicase HerA-like ATPase
MTDQDRRPVGMVLGTESSTPLEWWVAIDPDTHLQLDDVVAVRTLVSGNQHVQISGLVDLVRAQHEGSRFESDVFLADKGVLPLKVARSARVITTRVEPETWVPPRPGDTVFRVTGEDRDLALHFDRMEQRLAAGFSRDGLPVYLDLSFLDGRRGAHVNISGVSGVATKTSYASFLLFSLFGSEILGNEAANTKALIFNVKGEDLLFLDHANRRLGDEDRSRYAELGLTPGAFQSVGIWARVRRGGGNPVPDTGNRQQGVRSYFWTVRDVVREGLLRFMFAEAGDERSQVADLVARVETILARESKDDPDQPAAVTFEDSSGVRHIRSFEALCEFIDEKLSAEHSDWVRYASPGTVCDLGDRDDGPRRSPEPDLCRRDGAAD